MTQERLAERSGVAVRTIQRLEAGEDASLETLALIASALEVDVQELFASVDRADLAEAIERLDVIRAEQKRESDEQSRRRQRLRRRLIGAALTVVGVLVLLLLALFLSHWISGATTSASGSLAYPVVTRWVPGVTTS